ncbi:HWE histidine kinase domain-containing protein [Pseudomonas sp.]|uniref:HWE histidine kinase domain-containing protein n=1 Tax=Pseudomonas sp. TaxID=306 RepID=UPI002ED7A475
MTSEPRVDLTNCDREAIHIPGSIQPHGCLLACDASALTVLRHSMNAPVMLGVSWDINGGRLEAVLGAEAAHVVRNSLARTQQASRPALTFGLTIASGEVFDVSAHVFNGTALIELEPAGASVAEPIELARTVIVQVRAIDQTDTLFRDAARFARAMLGYDRVMVYQLGSEGSGNVIAEAKRSGLDSFLGQYFPGSDIPQQARALYLRNPIRIISNAQCETVAIEPQLDLAGEPLDLSYSHLRSVSPVHCEYLRNMGVGASMSISIIVNGVLWGLIACHHDSPRTLTMGQRVAAEMFAEFFSLHLETLRAKQTLKSAAYAREVLDMLLRDANRAPDFHEYLRAHLPNFKALIPCDGIGMELNGQWSAEGVTPPDELVPTLLRFAEGVADGRMWASSRLSMAHAPAAGYAVDVSGAMVIPLSQRPKDYLLLFRKEVVETLDWAGNPNKPDQGERHGDRLHPRKSFAIWKETVHQQSLPWTEQDRQFGDAIRAAIVEVALHNSELLTSERSTADVRQRMLNDELTHRVKNILSLIGALVAHPTVESQTLNAYVATLKGRIQALSLAHDQIVRGDGGGRLSELLDAELLPYRTSPDAIQLAGPNILLDARAYSVMALVLHELATNAAKYGALSQPSGNLSVSWNLDDGGACKIAWYESGGPAVTAPSRSGFGSVLISRSIPFDLEGTSTLEYRPEGLAAFLKIPAKHFTLAEPVETALPVAAVIQPSTGSEDLSNACVLIVEDQLIIAVGLEQILAGAGIQNVITVGSDAGAMKLLATLKPDVAVLDINLGKGTSIPVADELTRQNIPFIFATGYGVSSSGIPDRLKHVPVVRKPYDAASILLSLQTLIRP